MSTTSQDPNHRTPGLTPSSSAPFGQSGLSGIVEGLRNLLEGRSREESWIIVPQQPSGDQPYLSEHTMKRTQVSGRHSYSWIYWSSELLLPHELLLPDSPLQGFEYACAFLSAHLGAIAERNSGLVIRIDRQTAASNAPALMRTWYAIVDGARSSTPVSHEDVRTLLCEARRITPARADQVLEAHANTTGLILIADKWFMTQLGYVLPPLIRADYDRIVRALQAHIRGCHDDRLRHESLGNDGAARALEEEETAATRQLDRMEQWTARLP